MNMLELYFVLFRVHAVLLEKIFNPLKRRKKKEEKKHEIQIDNYICSKILPWMLESTNVF